MQRSMDDLVFDAEENMASCEEISSEETEDVKVCDICGDVGDEKKLAVCSRCNDGAEHTYCMWVMIQEVPESGWLCEECQTEVEIEKEKKKLGEYQVSVGTISPENKVDAENVGHKESSKDNQGNDMCIKRKEEDARIIDKPESRTCNVRYAPFSSCADRNRPSFPMESEVGNIASGYTPAVKEEDSSLCIGVSEAVNVCEQISSDRNDISILRSLNGQKHSLERWNNDVSCISDAKDMSNVAARNKRLNTRSEAKSSEEIEDVKVCDICGDVGEEEKLAVCSRCNDGAEHIYCMRVMMEEVPEDKWLCEACQTEVEIEKKRKKLEKPQVMVGASKGQSFEEQMNKPVNAANSSSSENEMEAENVDSKESSMKNQPSGMATQRKEEDTGITSLIRQNLSEPGGVSIEGYSRKRVPVSRKSSLKFNATKGKEPARQMPTSLASNALKNQTPPLRGQLSKSISFNDSKVPKVKQLVIEVPLKPQNLKKPLSCIAKLEGPMSTLAKSASFKKPNSSEPANKGKSSILPHAEEPRVMNSPMSRNVMNKRGTSIFGYPSVTASMVAPVPSKAESAAQHLNKRDNIDNLDIAYGQGGHSEPNKQLVAKRPGSITLTSAETSSGMLGSDAQRKVIQTPDTSHWADKMKNPPSLRPSASSSSHTMHCQRCNEVGHCTQFCPVDKISLAATKSLSEKSKDRTARSNRTSEVANLVATEEARSADQSEPTLKCRPYHNPLYKPIDILCTSISHERTNEHDMRNGMSTPSSTASVDCPKLKCKEHQAVSAMGRRILDSSSTMLSDLTDKTPIFSPSDEGTASTFPELAYIWQGCFELWRSGRSPELCEGLQVHLSCSASPKVLEVVKKFPSKIRLEELPRQNLWPLQFHENGPIYDSIGLFFFARDTQSYENYYSKLVDNMLKDDLALRGNIETAELLIFPSNILSKNFQRWNMFFYLWGVFRVRRKDWNLPPHVPISKHSNFNDGLLAVDLRTPVFSSSHSFSKDQNNGAETDPTWLKSATCKDSQCLQPVEANHEGCSNGENSLNQPVYGGPLEDQRHESITASFSTDNNSALNDFVTAPTRKNQKHAYSEHQDKMWDSSDGKERPTIKHDNAEHLMDVGHGNTTEVSPRNVGHISHVSGGAHKRDVETANWADEVNISHKKIKLDNGCSVNPMLG